LLDPIKPAYDPVGPMASSVSSQHL